MEELFADYIWKQGVPRGTQKKDKTGFKIVMDPYRKRISIEQYEDTRFVAIIYDSSLLDFRKLTPQDQMVWRRTVIEETGTTCVSLIRDAVDRLILIEIGSFDRNFCTQCEMRSPQGTLLSTHKMHSTKRGDSFNGVILYDATLRPVMCKKYEVNEHGDFTILKEEIWDGGQIYTQIS